MPVEAKTKVFHTGVFIAFRPANGTLIWQETTGRSAAGAQCSNVDMDINSPLIPSPLSRWGEGRKWVLRHVLGPNKYERRIA